MVEMEPGSRDEAYSTALKMEMERITDWRSTMRLHRTLLERAADEIKDLMWRYNENGEMECRNCWREREGVHKDNCATAAILKEIEEASEDETPRPTP